MMTSCSIIPTNEFMTPIGRRRLPAVAKLGSAEWSDWRRRRVGRCPVVRPASHGPSSAAVPDSGRLAGGRLSADDPRGDQRTAGVTLGGGGESAARALAARSGAGCRSRAGRDAGIATPFAYSMTRCRTPAARAWDRGGERCNLFRWIAGAAGATGPRLPVGHYPADPGLTWTEGIWRRGTGDTLWCADHDPISSLPSALE